MNTANIKVLSSNETTELFKKMKEGDYFAREDLINGNLKLVLSILKKYTGKNTSKIKVLYQLTQANIYDILIMKEGVMMEIDENEYFKKYKDFREENSSRREQYIADDDFIYGCLRYLSSKDFNTLLVSVLYSRPELLEDETFMEALKEEALRRVFPVVTVSRERKKRGLL